MEEFGIVWGESVCVLGKGNSRSGGGSRRDREIIILLSGGGEICVF